MISGRRRSVIFFTVLGVCLVAAAVTLNIGWVVLNWQRWRAGRPGHRPLHPHHRRHGAQHHLPGAGDSAERAARFLHQRRHPRAEDARGVDSPVPADAAEPRAGRGQAARVLPHHAGGQRPVAADDRAGPAGRELGVALAPHLAHASRPRSSLEGMRRARADAVSPHDRRAVVRAAGRRRRAAW